MIAETYGLCVYMYAHATRDGSVLKRTKMAGATFVSLHYRWSQLTTLGV